ncbi:MAG: SDR family oxidoreductase [Actinobacteria bacterium]|uniref:Unannotated protein n=1 Tax=freshwater metagenome TaxID=449393 RepID=A0A6J5YSN0_9ZZZZ|nr:SDR family oxidoreductase [Actinomycetota bacterium]
MSTQRIIVTGAASGIGYASVELALKNGMTVAAIDKSPAISEVFRGVENVFALQVDVSQPSNVIDAFSRIHSHWNGPASKLVCAHGIYRFKESIALSPQEWHEVISTNQDSTFYVLQAFGRELISESQPGAAVVVSSIAAQRGDRTEPGAHYASSKAALLGLMSQLAVEWGNAKIRVNAVSPGYIDTPMLRIVEDEVRTKDIVDNVIPLQRLGVAQDVARGCLWLLSEDASYITGANLPIDGGLSVI